MTYTLVFHSIKIKHNHYSDIIKFSDEDVY